MNRIAIERINANVIRREDPKFGAIIKTPNLFTTFYEIKDGAWQKINVEGPLMFYTRKDPMGQLGAFVANRKGIDNLAIPLSQVSLITSTPEYIVLQFDTTQKYLALWSYTGTSLILPFLKEKENILAAAVSQIKKFRKNLTRELFVRALIGKIQTNPDLATYLYELYLSLDCE
ncbi:MAG: mRNA decapping complex regulatory subunit Dcp1 [Amphiamblys sp. WSBS2006]|nr:MAG: mRNA decapping complex regulatory subunit Dcp1 [Amphiamblys sp. WSBS2006]